MCSPASFVVTKEKVFWSKKSDSHEDIISEFELKDTNCRQEATLVRVEISPENQDYRKPLDEWVFKTDQDILPNWYDAAEAEKRVRRVLPEWFAEKILIEMEVEIRDRNIVAAYDCKLTMYGQSQAKMYGQSQAKMYGQSQAKMYGQSQAEMYDQSQAEMHNQSQAKMYGQSQAEMYDQSQAEMHGQSQAKMYDQSQAEMYGQSITVSYTANITKAVLKSKEAVLVDRSGDAVKCYTGGDND